MGKTPVAKLLPSNLSIACLATLSGMIAPVMFFVILAIVETLQSGYNLIQETISRLALGPYGSLQTIAFIIFGLLLIVFAIRLGLAIDSTSRSARVGIFFFTIIGVGFIIVGIFPTDTPGVAQTLHALIHKGTSVTIALLFPLACLAVAPALKGDTRWKGIFVYTIVTGTLTLILLILGTVMRANKLWSGLYERVLLLNGLIWIELVSFRLLHLCRCGRREAKQIKPATAE